MNFNDIAHPSDILIDLIPDIKERWGRGKDISLSFLPTLDKKLWGIKRKNLVVIAGRPTMGKSDLLLNIAYSAATQKKKVLFFSLEMSKEKCVERLISDRCEVENTLLETGQVIYKKEFDDKIQEFYEELKTLDLIFLESHGKTIPEILNIIENFGKQDLIIIDYVNMIKTPLNQRRGAIDEYIKDLRVMAKDMNFCAVIGAQISRETHKNKDSIPKCPNMWELKESGALEEIADLILIVHWEHKYKYEVEGIEDDKEKYIIKVAKNKEGRTGEFECRIQPQFCRISEVEEKPYPDIPRNNAELNISRKDFE